MFTGLIEEVGKVESVSSRGGAKDFTIKASLIMDDIKVDDSVSINGACQTVIRRNRDTFTVTAVEATLAKTTLSMLARGNEVNLERALRLSDRLGGHFVQGHIDCTGTVRSLRKLTSSVLITIDFPAEYAKYLIRAGSVCLDGVSLTASEVNGNSFTVSVIPHSLENTILKSYSAEQKVNLEFDLMAKYIEKLMPGDLLSVNNSGHSALDKYIDQPFI